MSETIDMATGEVIETTVTTTALAPTTKTQSLIGLVKDADLPLYNIAEQLDSLDWAKLKPHQAAILLMSKPFPVAGGGNMTLTLKQALLFAVRAYELGLSPFSDNVWFDPNRGVVNLTMSGKRELARLRGIDLGPPNFEEVYREWSVVPKITSAGEDAKKMGFKTDHGVKCTMRVGDPAHKEHVSYTAWINDWFVSRSPVWKEKPGHMLTIRANEKALTLVLGTGASAMPDEKELEG